MISQRLVVRSSLLIAYCLLSLGLCAAQTTAHRTPPAKASGAAPRQNRILRNWSKKEARSFSKIARFVMVVMPPEARAALTSRAQSW